MAILEGFWCEIWILKYVYTVGLGRLSVVIKKDNFFGKNDDDWWIFPIFAYHLFT